MVHAKCGIETEDKVVWSRNRIDANQGKHENSTICWQIYAVKVMVSCSQKLSHARIGRNAVVKVSNVNREKTCLLKYTGCS